MLKVNHCEFKNMEIEDYRAKFITRVDRGMRSDYEIFDTLQKAKDNSSYDEIYIAFILKNK